MSGRRVLIVDDNLLNRKLACDVLELEGYDVQSCEDADQALALLARDPLPDLVLMDISLPGMDGLSLTRLLKTEPRFAGIPVVAMTAFAMKGDEQKALAAGCAAYITKPIDTRRLAAQVQAVVEQRAAAESGLRIMIVEDHRLDLKLVTDTARLSGHVVLSNTTAEQALTSLRDGHPDVVLLDLNLPGMDGLSFLRLLRAEPAYRGLPVVAVTAFPDDRVREQLMEAGCTAYLVKPVDRARLMKALVDASASGR